jgi:hypothetical protein
VSKLPALEFYGGPSGFVDLRFAEEMTSKIREEDMKTALRVEQEFRERVRLDGIEGEWRKSEGLAAQTIARHARYADLAILGQTDPGDTSPAGASNMRRRRFSLRGDQCLSFPMPGTIRPLDSRCSSVGRVRARLHALSTMPCRCYSKQSR